MHVSYGTFSSVPCFTIRGRGGNPELLGEKASLITEIQYMRLVISRMCALAIRDPPRAHSAARLPDRSCHDSVPGVQA